MAKPKTRMKDRMIHAYDLPISLFELIVKSKRPLVILKAAALTQNNTLGHRVYFMTQEADSYT
ncbi:MAG TPA: hypothetical protein DD454_02250 [Candidatus Moranbacteria bacterium]|nr:hypothetical protein [Candidatus Moranbacteria bacterium]